MLCSMHARTLLVIAFALLVAWPVASASAADPVLPEKLVTPNFVVHYTTAAGSPDAITPATAQVVGDNAEKSLSAERAAFGFDTLLSGPDAHVDIYVYDLRAASEDGVTGPRSPDADQSESYILLRTGVATSLSVTAHEMFHALQDSVWVPGGKFLDEATAVWAQERAFPDEGFSTDLDPAQSLDCADPTACPDAGYQSWSFFSSSPSATGRASCARSMTRPGRCGSTAAARRSRPSPPSSRPTARRSRPRSAISRSPTSTATTPSSSSRAPAWAR